MRSLCYLLVLLACISHLVSAQGSNAIVVPPNGFEVTAGQPITIEYTNPSLLTVTIQLVPASGSGNIITLDSVLPANGSATVLIPSDVATTQQYKFKILDDSNSSNVYFSPAFNISPPIPGSASSSTPASSSAAATAGSTSSSSTNPPSNNSLSTGAIAGIAIGVAFGLLLLVGISTFFFCRRRKHKNWIQEHQQQPPPSDHAPAYDMNHQYDPMHPHPPPQKQMVEVPGSRSWPREMEGMSRFQQMEVVELPAEPVGGGVGGGKK